MRAYFMLLTLALLVGACMQGNYGNKVEQSSVKQFREGVTKYSDVVATLGEPSSATSNSDGTRTAIYWHSKVEQNLAGVIPGVNLVAGGMSTETETTTFKFDRNGTLLSYSTTGTRNCATGGVVGVAAGAKC